RGHRESPGRRPLQEKPQRTGGTHREQSGGQFCRSSSPDRIDRRHADRRGIAPFPARGGESRLMRITRATVAIALAVLLLPASAAQAEPPGLAAPANTLAQLISENRKRIGRGEAEAAYAALRAQL